MKKLLAMWPFTSTYRTPNYSDMAFQLLAYAVENITGQPFAQLVTRQLVKPLNLRRTFLSEPGNQTTNAVIVDGWDLDFGDEAP